MPVIINEVEVIAPPPRPETVQQRNPEQVPPAGPTPHDIYRVTRKLMERRLRLQAR